MRKLIMMLAAIWMISIMAMAESDWRAYISFHDVNKCLSIKDKVYALGSGALFTYRFGQNNVQTYSKSTGLSGTNIIHMAYCEELEEILLIYEDFNIDIVTLSDSIINIPQYKNSSFIDKTINDVLIFGHEAFLATNFGVVVINLKRAEFSNAYETGMKIRSAVGDDDVIYALGPEGIYVGDRRKNLLEASNWTLGTTQYPKKLIIFNGDIYALATPGLYTLDAEKIKINKICDGSFSYYSTYGENLILGNAQEIVVMNKDEEFERIEAANDFVSISSDGQYIWAARNLNGLQAFKIENDSLKIATAQIIPNSPIRNYFDRISFDEDRRLLIAGGALAYSGQTKFEPTAMIFENGKWFNFSEDSIALKTGILYNNITSIAQDPKDKNHHYLSSATGGLYEFLNYEFVNHYDCDNSPISSIMPTNTKRREYSRLTGATFDDKGNLWMFNNQVDTVMRVLTNQGKWLSLYQNELKGHPTFDQYLFDKRGWVWITHRRWAGTYQAGIGCLNYNGTLSNTNDDKFTFCSTFTNQNGSTTQLSLLYTAQFDRNDQLWIGTNNGVYVLEDPTTIFSSNITFRQPAVPRNDGTNYADYLLEGVPVRAIAVDGANRKWLGTTNSGLYLVSADGLEILEHFTAEETPLISNSILSLAINPDNGLLMIGTDKGLMSYRADATEPAEELKESNIKAFPNPVRPYYTGKIRITGFSSDSDVKITTSTGVVVTQGTSLGGTFVWDGTDTQGKRVATGVYYVIASDSEAKNGVAAKILVVK